MKFFSLIIIIFTYFFFHGCAPAAKEAVEKEIPHSEAKSKVLNPRKAMEYFLRGVALENRGDLASAILEYQEALEFDQKSGIYYSIAKNYLLLNKLSFALQNAHKALVLDSTEAEYYFLLNEIYISSRMSDSAAVVLEKLLQKDSMQLRAYYKLARQYEPTKPRKATEIYEALLRKTGKEWTVLLRLAELYEKLGLAEKAIVAMESVLTIDPDNAQVVKILADYYIRYQREEDALNLTNNFLLSYPDDIEFLELKGRVYIAWKDYKTAISSYQKILENDKIEFSSKLRIANDFFTAALKDSSLMEPVKSLFNLLDHDTTAWQVKMYLGAIAIEQKDDSSAIKYFSEVTSLDPKNKEAWIRLGGLLFDNRKYEQAVTLLSEAITKFPDDFTINFILGLSYSQIDKDSIAEKYLIKAIQLNPTEVNALSSYGYTLNKLKRNADAAIFLEKALQLEPGNVNLLGTLGLIYDSLERFLESDSVYEAALHIDPRNALVSNNYAYALSKRNERMELALEMVTNALKQEPANSAYLDTKGWILYKLGDFTEARTYIERAIELGGKRPVIIDHLGDVLYKLGEGKAALEEWRKAYDIDPNIQGLKDKIERESID